LLILFIILLFGASFFAALGYHLVMVGNEVDKHSLIGVDILDQDFLFLGVEEEISKPFFVFEDELASLIVAKGCFDGVIHCILNKI